MGKDTIYRQDAANEVQRFLGYIDQDMIDRIKIAIGRLPSSEPKLDKNDMPEQGDSTKFGVITGETCAYWDRESSFCALRRPSAQPDRGHAEQIKWERDIAIQQLKELGYFFDEEFAEGIAEISLFPSAQPERKVGRWIDMDDHVMCSCCGAAHYGVDKNFCPNCGADMREEEQE